MDDRLSAMNSCFYYNFPTGRIGIAEEDGYIVRVFFANPETDDQAYSGKDKSAGFLLRESPLIKEAAKQLDEYFAGERRGFDLPLLFKGTDFQKKVWEALLTIPYGETRTYSKIAAQVENPKGCRAVGLANNRNPIVIICPCHRVIGKNGSLTGFGGGLPAKEYLLALEKNNGAKEQLCKTKNLEEG